MKVVRPTGNSGSVQIRMARSARRWLAAWFAALHVAFPATAQEALPFPGRTATVTIMPAVADAGSARVITVSGMWNNGCIPVGASSSIGSALGERLYTVTLALPETLAPCTAAFTPYSHTVTLTTIEFRGRYRLLVKTSLGEYLAEAAIDVRAASDNRPRADITGVWYEPSTNGSGLTFVQSAQVADLVFGTWYVYSADGGSRWYTIQNTTWRSQGSVLEGDLYETRAAGTSCPAPLESCPVPFSALAVIGRARFTLSDEHNGRIEALTALGSTLFASNITRIRF